MANSYKCEVLGLYIICLIIILLRIFTCCLTRGGPRKWQGDDWLILILLALLCVSMYGLSVQNRYGNNSWFEPDLFRGLKPEVLKEISYGSMWNFIDDVCYASGLATLKACLVCFYWRLTDGLWKIRKLCIVSAVVIGVSYFISIILLVTQCTPVSAAWEVDSLLGAPQCASVSARFTLFLGISNILTDLLMLSIPIPLLYRVQVPLARKIFLFVLLCGGIFVTVATFLRVYFTIYGERYFITHHKSSTDYAVANNVLWGLREATLAIVVVNAPCIVPLFRKDTWAQIRGKQNRQSCLEMNRHSSHLRDSALSHRGLVLENNRCEINNSGGAGTLTKIPTAVVRRKDEDSLSFC